MNWGRDTSRIPPVWSECYRSILIYIYTCRAEELQSKVIKTESKIEPVDRLKNRLLYEIYKYYRSYVPAQ